MEKLHSLIRWYCLTSEPATIERVSIYIRPVVAKAAIQHSGSGHFLGERGELTAIIAKSGFQNYLYIGSYLLEKSHVRKCIYEGALLLKQILSEFLMNTSVTTAALVGRDGFVIDVATTTSLDRDALGALGSSSINFFEKGSLMEHSKLRQMTMEYLNGAIILTPITREEFLMILTNTTHDLGNLCYRIAYIRPRVAAAM